MKNASWFPSLVRVAALAGMAAWSLAGAVVAGAQEPREYVTRAGNRVWFYRPTGDTRGGKAPCLVIGAAGSRLFHGMRLADGDKPEHLPYLQHGFAVVAFEISGAWDGAEASISLALRTFLAADLGVKDAIEALDLVLEKEPGVDAERVFIAGHSSAGTLALQAAATTTRFKACLAYAPVADFDRRFGRENEGYFEARAPGSFKRLLAASPLRLVRDITIPVFLFHAADDERVSRASVIALERNMNAAHVPLTFVKTETGGHYDAMIREGIPAAITFLKRLEP